jgi:hypothetical protein
VDNVNIFSIFFFLTNNIFYPSLISIGMEKSGPDLLFKVKNELHMGNSRLIIMYNIVPS